MHRTTYLLFLGRHESSNHLSHAYAHTVNNASTSPNLVPHPETNEYMAYRDNSNTILGRSEFLRLNQPFHVWSAQGDSLPALRSPAGDELLDLGWPEAELLYAFPYAEETQRMERFQDFPNPSQESGEEHQASAPSWARSPFLNDLSISDGFNTLHHNQMILDNPRMPVFERTELQFQTDTSHSSNRDGLTKKERRLLPSQSPCDVDGDSDCKITGSRKIPAILEGDSDCEIVGSRKVKKGEYNIHLFRSTRGL